MLTVKDAIPVKVINVEISFLVKASKEILRIYIRYMTTSYNSGIVLFDDKNCPDCQKLQQFINNNKPFPTDANFRDDNKPRCEKCFIMKHEGDDFLLTRYGEYDTPPYSKTELQIQWFERHRQRFLFSDGDKVNKKIKDIQTNILDNVEDKELKTVMKSYVRQNYGNVRMAFLNVGFLHGLRDEVKYSKGSDFFYRSKPYQENIILKLIVYEYILALSGDNIFYVELDDIHQYLDEVFD